METVQMASDLSSPTPNGHGALQFGLYITGHALNSMQAVGNLREICERHLPGCHSIEVVDVFREPARALADAVFFTPTLVILPDSPSRRIIGNLSDYTKVLHVLTSIGSA